MSSHDLSKARKCNNLLHLEYSIAGHFCLPGEGYFAFHAQGLP